MSKMSYKRVTMQDIANACGLSRNTVSKVFNGRGVVQESTRRLILETAKKLGFNQFPADWEIEEEGAEKEAGVSLPTYQKKADLASSNLSSDDQDMVKTIAVLSESNPLNHNFGSQIVKFFTDQICREGYTVQLYEISREELLELRLPPHVSAENTAGILGIELFDRNYIDMLCEMDVPMLTIDGYLDANRSAYKCDLLAMESVAATAELTQRLIDVGATRIGFVGDIDHCNSFHERWGGYAAAMKRAGLPIRKELCILEPDRSPYWNTEWVVEQIRKLPELPEAFVCANDYYAIQMLVALRQMGISVPKEVMVTGFDDGPESRIVDPPLTTVNVPAREIGVMAADILLSRLHYPEFPYHFTYVQTVPVYRKSTR